MEKTLQHNRGYFLVTCLKCAQYFYFLFKQLVIYNKHNYELDSFIQNESVPTLNATKLGHKLMEIIMSPFLSSLSMLLMNGKKH